MPTRRNLPSDPSFDGADPELDLLVARAEQVAYERLPALSAFQRRMEQFPQLPGGEQAALAEVCQQGRVAQQQIDAGALTGRRLAQARQRAADAEQALERLVMGNIRLVLLICREQLQRRYGTARTAELLPDLVAEGNVALTEAAYTYDPRRTPRFATYAARTIRDHVRTHVADDEAMSLPTSVRRVQSIAAGLRPEMESALGRPPTVDELRDAILERALHWAYERLTDQERSLPEPQRLSVQYARLRKQGMLRALAELEKALQVGRHATSLDAPFADGTDRTHADRLADPGDTQLLDGAERADLRRILAEAIGALDERERDIIALRYGLVDNREWTYNEIADGIADRHGRISAERVRQIDREVLRQLRESSPARGALAAFLPQRPQAA